MPTTVESPDIRGSDASRGNGLVLRLYLSGLASPSTAGLGSGLWPECHHLQLTAELAGPDEPVAAIITRDARGAPGRQSDAKFYAPDFGPLVDGSTAWCARQLALGNTSAHIQGDEDRVRLMRRILHSGLGWGRRRTVTRLHWKLILLFSLKPLRLAHFRSLTLDKPRWHGFGEIAVSLSRLNGGVGRFLVHLGCLCLRPSVA